MQNLLDWQSDFAAFLNGQQDASLGPSQHVYRNNFRQSLLEVGRSVFPLCQVAVGEEFFDYLWRSYLQTNKLQSPELDQYVRHFPSFLSTVEQIARHQYFFH